MSLNYEKDVQINLDALDIESVRYSHTFWLYCEEERKIGLEVQNKQQYYDYIKAENELELKRNPAIYCKKHEIKLPEKNLTEQTAKSVLLITQFKKGTNLNKAYNEFCIVKDKQNTIQNAIKALERKKTGIENLIKLLGQQYFASPRTPRDLRKELNKIKEERREEINNIVKIKMGINKKQKSRKDN